MSDKLTVTAAAISKYREALAKINAKAAEELQAYMLANSFKIDEKFADFAFYLSNKYGEASAAVACEFYDSINLYWESNKRIAQAIPAEPSSYEEVTKTVYGTAKNSAEVSTVKKAVERLIKRTAEDTTIKNAIRDGAYFAWIPSGDTCAFCLTLASRGWQKASDKALKNGHAEHIHANCNCLYVASVRPAKVDGYDPDRYLKEYEDAGSVNALRREQYARNKDKINEQKRIAYKRRKESAEE